jgi:hypothetical protein
LHTVGDHTILEIRFESEDGGYGFEGGTRLSELAPLRDDILAGDYRTLYLAWLMAAQANDIGEELEPPLPPGLKSLSAPLAEFVDFFQIDPFLVEAAASVSEPLRPELAFALDAAIARLARAECDAFLRRLAAGEPLLSLKLNRRLKEIAETPAPPQQVATRRTWAELEEMAEALGQAELQRQQAAADARRIKDLQDFAAGAAQAWREIPALVDQKRARPYDEAVALLVKLRDLAVFQNRLPAFQARLATLQAQYADRPAFQERLRKAGLL